MIWTSQVAREIDQRSISTYGIPSLDLMEAAGLAVARMAMEIWKPGFQILIAAGAGNNGGDALVAARHLAEAGFDPLVYDIRAEQTAESPDRKIQRLRYEAPSRTTRIVKNSPDFAAFSASTLIIDGLLGLGPTQPLRAGLVQQCLEALSRIRARLVLAIDLPSGLLGDAWQQPDALLKATHTITFGCAKPIHRLEPGRSQCGVLRVVSLPFHPQAVHDSLQALPFVLQDDTSLASLPSPWSELPGFAHKYTRGHVLVIGGSAGKLGAPLFSAQASLRSGAGWASVALLSQDNAPSLPAQLTYEDFGQQQLDETLVLDFIEERRVKALVIGPGTMTNPLHQKLLQALQARQKRQKLFLVFDAGALKNWRSLAQGLVFDPLQTILTPHPGEWRAIHADHQDLTDLDSLAAAWQFCEEFGVNVFYKTATAFTISAWSRKQLLVNGDGTRALGKAGTGDVLAGVIAALGCAGVPANLAGNRAQRLVALSSLAAMDEFGIDGLGPEELISGLGKSL